MAKKKRKGKKRPQYKSGPKKGQFKSNRAIAAKKASGKKKRPKKKGKSTALAKRGKSNPVAKKKGRKNRRRGNPNGGGLMRDKDLMIGGAIYGFITKPAAEQGSLADTFTEQTAKLPDIGNQDITNGLALYFLDRYVWRNKYVRETSRAALTVGAVRFGRRGFQLGEGVGGDDDMGGALDVTEEGEAVSGVVG